MYKANFCKVEKTIGDQLSTKSKSLSFQYGSISNVNFMDTETALVEDEFKPGTAFEKPDSENDQNEDNKEPVLYNI